MKKIFLFAAAAMMVLACDKNNGGNDGGQTKNKVETAKENLVAYLPLESEANAVSVGQGISFGAKSGAAGFGEGFIGKAYTNTAGNNDEAYLKLNVAATNAIKSLEDITFTAWVKNVADFQKGAILSMNGTNPSGDWPAFIAYFDNKSAATDTDPAKQQVNGRVVFVRDGADVNLWLDTWDPAFAKYDEWFQFAFTYDHTSGDWALYINGAEVKAANFGDKLPFSQAVPADFNAFYVGGWASRIDGTSTADWQGYFAGSLDEIRIYNKALSALEIASLYTEEVLIAAE
ncbi:MAG: LamG domain-containing protein [Bacteroidales bacterium]|nr:LamG domain-containing protein [Bacteroidales bacterium]